MKVLIVEDSPEIVDAVSLCLQIRWPDVDIKFVAEGARALESLRSERYDVAILDINLPDLDGFAVLRRLREFSDVPVIMLTVRNREPDKTACFESGADDYIVKPFSPVDLVARISALLRRAAPRTANPDPLHITLGKLELYVASHEVRLRGMPIRLSPLEWKLLYLLAQKADHTVSGPEIMNQVWGAEKPDTDLLRTYIRRLRAKLGDSPPQMILTDHGEGYRFVAPR